MKIFKFISYVTLAASVALSGVANADVINPKLDIQDLGDDTGASVTATTFDIDATAFAIITDGTTIDIADQAFALTSTGSFDSVGVGLFSGSFDITGGLLSGTFTNLEVFDLGLGFYDFAGDVTYTGGSLAGSLSGGRFEGIIDNSFAGDSIVIGKLGAVVPVPAAVWLFASGLIGLIGIARRKSA